MSIINIGILAHVDAGKTTLTEQLLYISGKTRVLGSVDSGTSVTDSLDIERRRGISVKAACVSTEWKGKKINIIDTPGHIDFAGEVERALSAMDAAVLVISAVEGIQSHTRILWKALEKLSIPTLFVINKLDRAGSDSDGVIRKIKEEFGIKTVLLSAVTGERGACEICDILEKRPERTEDLLLDMEDDSLTERYLNGEIGKNELADEFNKKSKSRECFGVVLTSAKDGKGIEALLDKIVTCLPDSDDTGCDELSGMVFKIEHDKVMGVSAYIRLFGGEINNRDLIYCDEKEIGKISQIRVCDGQKFSDAGVLKKGEIGCVFGLTAVKCGDFIGAKTENRRYGVTSALMTVSVKPENESDKPAVMKALSELNAEDPLLNYEYSAVTGEMYLSITGIIQLEILEELIHERYSLKVEFSEPNVILKETPKITAVGYESYTMPKPCWAKVELQVEPAPRGAGVSFKSEIKDKVLPYRYQHHVMKSVMRDCVKQGIYGWEVTDASFTLIGGEYHSIHTHPLDFFVATPVAFLRALTNAKTVLLEPFLKVSMSAAEKYLGTVIGNILEMRGEFLSPVIENGDFSITAFLPVRDSVFYSSEFSSLTSGTGVYYSEFFEYRECPRELYKTRARIGADPLDRAKWILYCRSALD